MNCCIDCHKKVSTKNTKRCKSCANTSRWKIGKMKIKTGKDTPNCKGRRTLIQHYCKEEGCNNKIRYKTALYGKGRCQKCYLETKKGKGNSMFGVHILGKLHWNWQGGIGKLPYPFRFNNELKQKIRARDNHQCQICKIYQKDYYRKLDIHHIDYNKKNINSENLISLCQSCHMKTNYNRKYWKEYLQKGTEI